MRHHPRRPALHPDVPRHRERRQVHCRDRFPILIRNKANPGYPDAFRRAHAVAISPAALPKNVLRVTTFNPDSIATQRKLSLMDKVVRMHSNW